VEGIEIKGIEQLVKDKLAGANELLATKKEDTLDSLHSHIIGSFQKAKDARETSGVNQIMLDGLRAYNGTYSSSELESIGSGSSIWMNLTSNLCRVASSWIQDILVGTKSYSIKPTPIPELPEEEANIIASLVEEQFQKAKEEEAEAKAAAEQAQAEQGQEQGQEAPPPAPKEKVETLKEVNEYKRDLQEAILDALNTESNEAFEPIARQVADNLVEGEWDKAMLEFLDDFPIFPTAIMKGPVITKEPKLKWENGEAVTTEEYKFKNKRLNPLDIYPAPEASTPNEGDFIEHLRLDRTELYSLAKIGEEGGYHSKNIKKVLAGEEALLDVDDYIESELAEEELKGDREKKNNNTFHGLHFFGAVPVKVLKEWGFKTEKKDDEDTIEVEAILVGSEVIKCILNDDPLGRRPYFIASFQNRPGAFWGSSLAYLLRDVQKMCNGACRALADNMALSSGPQAEVNTNLLANEGPIEEIYPRKIWEVVSDPMGGGGRAINFFTVPSNAKELLSIYDRFEAMGNDISMIPRHAYTNEATQGAHQTFNGLAMLLEGASKGIKGTIRRIDYGVIIPRVQYEFYHIMLKGEIDYTGDIEVHALGSGALTMRASEELKRQEFLRIITQPAVMAAIGEEGIISLVKEIAEGLGLNESIVPTRFELKQRDKKKAENAQAAQKAELDKALAPTNAQVQGQMKMHEGTQQTAQMQIQQSGEIEMAKLQLKQQAEDLRTQSNIERDKVSLRKTEMQEANKADMKSKEIALSLQGAGTGDRDKAN